MAYPTRKSTARVQPNIAAQTEKIQALTGALGAQAGKEAVTREMLASFGTVAMRSISAAAAPTQAEYNALVEDVHAIANLLNQLGANFTRM